MHIAFRDVSFLFWLVWSERVLVVPTHRGIPHSYCSLTTFRHLPQAWLLRLHLLLPH